MTFEQVCKTLIIREPFWGLFMLGLNKKITKEIPSTGLSIDGINYCILINPDYWETLTDNEQIASIIHLLYHISFGHPIMSRSFENKEVFEIASDLETNCYFNIPKTLNTPTVEDYNFDPCLGTLEYYKKLLEQQESNSSNSGGDQNPENQESSGNNNSNSNQKSDSHENWKDYQNFSENVKEIIQNIIDGQLKAVAETVQKHRGKFPAGLETKLKKLLKPLPRVYDWKKHFRRFLGSKLDINLKQSFKRFSKRFEGSPGIKFKRKVEILIAVDTSGSISNKELLEFFSEIDHIVKSGASITLLQFDSEVQKISNYTPKQVIDIKGRGGTSFDPPFEYFKKNYKKYTSFIIFTDGYAPYEHLKRYPKTMWLISSTGIKGNYPGKVIYIPKQS